MTGSPLIPSSSVQAKELAAEAAKEAEEQNRSAILQEERMKLLREAAAVRQCLPPGTLTADDVALMRQANLL